MEFVRSIRSSKSHRKVVREDPESRKAAAWAWHQRAGGDATSTWQSMAKITTPVIRNCNGNRPKTRFSAEAVRQTDCNSAFKSESLSETDPSSEVQLSSVLKQIAFLAETLRKESLLDDSLVRSLDGLSGSCRFRQHKSDPDEHSATLSRRSYSCLSDSRQYHHTRGRLKMEGDTYDSESREKKLGMHDSTDRLVTKGVLKHRDVGSFRKSIFAIKKLCPKFFRTNAMSHSATSELVHNHHHYHHHHHYHYYDRQFSNEELQHGEQPNSGRFSETFVDQGTQRIRRQSESDLRDGLDISCYDNYYLDHELRQPMADTCTLA